MLHPYRAYCRRVARAVLVLWLCLVLALPVHAGRIGSGALIAQTVAAAPHCMQWMIIGLCFWLYCTPFGCSVRVSVLIGNYNPDLVVSGYHRVGDNPWRDMAAVYGPAQRLAVDGFAQLLMPDLAAVYNSDNTNDTVFRSHKDLLFKETDAIGHPIASLLPLLPPGSAPAGEIPDGFGLQDVLFICPSETESLFPYLLSGFDFFSWRLPIAEWIYGATWVPGLREIGSGFWQTWGPVHPRLGFVFQPEPPKAGAVIAQRAGDIVTRQGQPHVYAWTGSTRSSTGGLQVWYPGPLYERNRKTGYWQFHVPLSTQRCEVFGQDDRIGRSWADGKVDENGDYAWTLWRPYTCCKRRGQVLLEVIQWVDWPP